MADAPRLPRPRHVTSVALWALALLLAAATMIYQRRTGPTYPLRGTCTLDDRTVAYRLIRTQETTAAARVTFPAWKPDAGGTLHFRRYPTGEAFTARPLLRSAGAEELHADLPVQPAAGKIEYFLMLDRGTGPPRVPATEGENPILRYKDPVPRGLLIAHIAVMVLAILAGVRTGLAAIFTPGRFRRLAWFTFLCLTAGGLVLGPMVQKHAFGAYWTGVPFGWDLTDNKMLVMWVVWLLALLVLGFRPRPREIRRRLAVVGALIVMLGVYLVPHSLRGSELDYEKLDRGVAPRDAIGTGDR